MNLLTVCGVAAAVCVMSIVFRGVQSDFAKLFPLAGIVLIAAMLLPSLSSLLTAADALRGSAGLEDTYFSVLLRGIGIVFASHLTSGYCADCGQKALGELIACCGRVAVALLAAPLVLRLAETVTEMPF